MVCAFHAEAQVNALKQQQPAVHISQQPAGIVTASQARLQSPEDQEQILDIREPYDGRLHGQSQTCAPSKHMQHQTPHATVTSDTIAPSASSVLSEKSNSPTHQAVDLTAHPSHNSGIVFQSLCVHIHVRKNNTCLDRT